MTRRSKIVLLVCGSLAVMIAVYLLTTPREPVYAGKTLSAWLRGFESDTGQVRTQAADAVGHIGTNGLPIIVAMLRDPGQKTEPAWKRWLRNLASKQSLIKINIPRSINPRTEALAALDALGPFGKDAVPHVEKLLTETPPDPRAPLVLARLGTNGIPALTRALNHSERAIRFSAQACLDALKSHSPLVFPENSEAGDFMRRSCELNVAVLRAAFLEYKRDHPEGLLPVPTSEDGQILDKATNRIDQIDH